MKQISKIIIKTIAMLVLLFSFSGTVFALTKDYTPLAPLPGTTKSDNTTNLETYIPNAFKLSIAVAAVMAFVMITFGGITYATSDAIAGKSQGREFVENAIWGLVLVIGAWIILNTINPKILHFDLSIPKPNVATSTGAVVTSGVPMTPQQLAADQAIRSSLPSGVTAYRGPCSNGQTTDCVNLNGIQPSVINGLHNLQIACKCDVSIRGGTEGGHTTNSDHYNGTAVDISQSPEIQKQVAGNNVLVPCKIYIGPSSSRGGYMWEPKGSTCGGTVASSNDHWHVVY